MADGQPKEWSRIGFMQGRLVDQIDDRIQAFPLQEWRQELELASMLDFPFLEWTIDRDTFDLNPILDEQAILYLACDIKDRSIKIASVTLDIFMQAPYYVTGSAHIWDRVLHQLITGSAHTGLKIIVIPFVDNSHIESKQEEDIIFNYLITWVEALSARGIRIAFELDMDPQHALEFIGRFPDQCFGINYDTGNSASLLYNPEEELDRYGHRIINVHIKDRLQHGTTVPLGEGNADFPQIFRLLELNKYEGNFVLQTARAVDNDHSTPLLKYRDMVTEWMR